MFEFSTIAHDSFEFGHTKFEIRVRKIGQRNYSV
jgi:hypothetical protein